MADSGLQQAIAEVAKRYAEAVGKAYGDQGEFPRPMPRDYVACEWCSGKGCISCAQKRANRERELDAEYKRQFPDGPKPFFTARLDNPEEMAEAVELLHRDKIEQAFGLGGEGVECIVRKANELMAKRSKVEE